MAEKRAAQQQRANEPRLREAADVNNIKKVRVLLACNTNPNAQDEVSPFFYFTNLYSFVFELSSLSTVNSFISKFVDFHPDSMLVWLQVSL